MSFWEDASGVTKGFIIFGILGILISGYVYFAEPGGTEEPVTQERGLQPPS